MCASSQRGYYFRKREENHGRYNEIKEMQEEKKKLTDILKTMKSTSVGYSEEKVSEDTLMYFKEGAKNTTFVIMDNKNKKCNVYRPFRL